MKKMIIILMLFSLFSTAFALQLRESEKQTDIITTMAKIEPFLILNNDKTVRFDKISAENTLDPKSIEIAITYVRLHNSVITATRNNQLPFQSIQDKEDIRIFEPFFLAVQQRGALTTQDLLISRPAESSPKAITNTFQLYKSVTINFSPNKKEKMVTLTCNGGSPTNPAYCPAWQFPSNQYSSLTAARNVLLQMGYHNTYAPGCGWNYPCTVDFTKWLSVNGCNLGVFRNQAIPYQTGSAWKVKFQTPEPNPEIYSYTWPAAVWWGTYVFWWHQLWPQPSGQLGC